MSAEHRLGARAEKAVAKALGTSRKKYRGRFERAADMAPVRLANGSTLIVESKARAKLPAWLVKALEQARGYLPGAVPVVALSELGGRRLAVLDLADLAALVGLAELPAQLCLPLAAEVNS